MKIFFYPHVYLRDRQIDTIRRWSTDEVINPEIAEGRKGMQVSAGKALAANLKTTWKQAAPLINLKLRPKDVPKDGVVYVWGALMATGDFIVDLDNPWSLVGYNLKAMSIYRWLIRRLLLSSRCREIRCMSEACRSSMRLLFGDEVYAKANVHYPAIPRVAVPLIEKTEGQGCRFLFVGTQFEIKGGAAMLRAFQKLYARHRNCRLDVITHLPSEYESIARACEGVCLYKASFTREEIHQRFMAVSDVLVLPTYVESFGMVALEALAHGMALIATDVYALGEMVTDGENGNLIPPPISIWDGVLPSKVYYDLENVKQHIRATDTQSFEVQLELAMERFVVDTNWRYKARQASRCLVETRFKC